MPETDCTYRSHLYETKPHTVPEETGHCRQSGGRRPGLGPEGPAEGWDWMGLGLGSAGRRPGLGLESTQDKRDSSPQSGTVCILDDLNTSKACLGGHTHPMPCKAEWPPSAGSATAPDLQERC